MSIDHDRFRRIEVDLWEGNGPQHLSVTARLAMLEEVAKNARWGFRLLVGVLVTALATLVLEMTKR